jgi:hypothetical protein
MTRIFPVYFLSESGTPFTLGVFSEGTDNTAYGTGFKINYNQVPCS